MATGSPLEVAFAAYKREQSAAHTAYFQAHIDMLYSEKYANLDDKKRLNKLARFWGSNKWQKSGHGSNITSPRELLILPGEPGYTELHIHDDGAVPLAAPEAQEQYVADLMAPVRQGSRDEEVPEPAEFIELLKLTDAISDMDFHKSCTVGLHGTCNRVSRYDIADNQPDQRDWYDAGWRVVSGWRTSYGDEHSATHMLYAEKMEGTPEEEELKWRVCTTDKHFPDGKWFDSIVEFMRYRSKWLERLPTGWEDQWPMARTC